MFMSAEKLWPSQTREQCAHDYNDEGNLNLDES